MRAKREIYYGDVSVRISSFYGHNIRIDELRDEEVCAMPLDNGDAINCAIPCHASRESYSYYGDDFSYDIPAATGSTWIDLTYGGRANLFARRGQIKKELVDDGVLRVGGE